MSVSVYGSPVYSSFVIHAPWKEKQYKMSFVSFGLQNTTASFVTEEAFVTRALHVRLKTLFFSFIPKLNVKVIGRLQIHKYKRS